MAVIPKQEPQEESPNVIKILTVSHYDRKVY